jgi:Flp pilus assembly protein TadG
MTRLMRLRKRAAGDGGQALVEFALILPVLLLMIIGIVEFARAWNIKQVITDAAREGARTAVVSDDDVGEDSVRTVISTALASGGVDPAAADVSIVPPIARPQPEGSTTVRIEVPFNFVFFGPIFNLYFSKPMTSSITLSTSFTMRNE